MLTNAVAFLQDVQKLAIGDYVLPHFVDFHTCDVCNQHCKGCAFAGHSGKMMEREKHFRAVTIFACHGVKAFDFAGGGEPTLLPYLPELFDFIHSGKMHYGLITNGTRLTDTFIEQLIKQTTYVRISLEASSREDYAQYKGVDGSYWDLVIDNVRKLVAEKKSTKSQCDVSLKFSYGKSFGDFDHFKRVEELVAMLGVDRYTMKPFRHKPETISTDHRVSEVPQCWLNPLHTVMDHNGDIYICCYYYYRNEAHRIGNIFTDGFERIWMSESHRNKIKNIDRKECAKVDCKFFEHHKAIDKALERGKVFFL